MKQIEELLREGMIIRDSIKPIELTENNSFIYDFEDKDAFNSWKSSLLKCVSDKEVLKLLNDAKCGVLLPTQIGRVISILLRLAGHENKTVSPLAPRSTDY